jgi:lysophospholipase L1-like esterase
MKIMIKKIAAALLGILAGLIIAEVILRIFNPIPMKIRGEKIVLPSNISYVIKNMNFPGLDPEIKYTKNSLGFRGDEIPKDFEKYLSFIAVGGSTTECSFLSDDKTWPYLLGERLKNKFKNVWINNAGLDGHSTFGHQILLQDYIAKIRPRFVLFLIGLNDIERADLRFGYDDKFINQKRLNWKDRLAQKSELANLMLNMVRAYRARRRGLVIKHELDLNKTQKLILSDDFCKAELEKQKDYLEGYKIRINNLIEISKKNHIEPIFISQPLLWGMGNELEKETDVSAVKITDKWNGGLYWQVLELYNNKLRSTCQEKATFFIDLAKEMPKNPKYFYDGMHFTNNGAEKVAEMVSAKIIEYLQNIQQRDGQIIFERLSFFSLRIGLF